MTMLKVLSILLVLFAVSSAIKEDDTLVRKHAQRCVDQWQWYQQTGVEMASLRCPPCKYWVDLAKKDVQADSKLATPFLNRFVDDWKLHQETGVAMRSMKCPLFEEYITKHYGA